MIHLQKTVENFRGFNRRQGLDLDGRLLLFYGLNGRGKSSIFQGLELVLFPTRAIASLREEAGKLVPRQITLTRFCFRQVGKPGRDTPLLRPGEAQRAPRLTFPSAIFGTVVSTTSCVAPPKLAEVGLARRP